MFKKKAPVMNPNTTDTLVGEGTVFEGKIKSEASIRIEGQVNGNVESAGDVTIGEKGSVKSNIIARNVVIAGTVNGNITAANSVRLMQTGKLYGNTTTQYLVIEEGGLFQGNSRIESAQALETASSKNKNESGQSSTHAGGAPASAPAPSLSGYNGSSST